MSSLRYVEGDATTPQGLGPKVIVHCVNNVGAWGLGFVLALSSRFEAPEAEYRSWFRGEPGTSVSEVTGPFTLGQVQFVRVNTDLWVANLIGQHGVGLGNGPPIRYGSIKTGLGLVREFCQKTGSSVHMPKMGAGLAGGSWPHIECIIKDELVDSGVDVAVYALPNS